MDAGAGLALGGQLLGSGVAWLVAVCTGGAEAAAAVALAEAVAAAVRTAATGDGAGVVVGSWL